MMKNPKVLLLCSFNQSTANGITIRHLFRGWPRDRIAVAEFNDDIGAIHVPEISRYYILGSKESCFIWPFCYLRKIRLSGAFDLLEAPGGSPVRTASRGGLKGKLRSALTTLQVGFLNKSGLALVSKKFNVSPEFESWVREFDPDFIYCSGGDICKLDFINHLNRYFQIPVGIHVFDDFLHSKHERTLFPGYWKKRLDTAFRRVVEAADLHLAIGDKMAAEYTNRYGKPFYGFHNPIDPEVWLSGENTERLKAEMLNGEAGKKASGGKVEKLKTKNLKGDAGVSAFSFIYAGKVNKDTVGPLIRFIEATEALSAKGHAVRLKIYSPYPFEEIYRLLGDRANEVYQGKVLYAELPTAFRGGDALLLPLDFTKSTIRYIRLSMLTKATEYMISGRPIFVFAPENIAVTEYLLAHDAAIHCGDPEMLEDAILAFIDDTKGRERVTGNAVRRAKEHHLMEAVGEGLRALMEAAAGGKAEVTVKR